MKLLTFLTIFLFAASFSGLTQQERSAQCANLNAIVAQMQEWRKSKTVVKFPLGNKREKRLIGHAGIESGGLERGTGAFYASSAQLEGEFVSEFGIDNEGKCFYTAYMGPYTKEKIDEEGQRLKNFVLSCVNPADWKVSDIPDVYLYINYNKIDIPLTILKLWDKGTGKFILSLSMFRFTPLK